LNITVEKDKVNIDKNSFKKPYQKTTKKRSIKRKLKYLFSIKKLLHKKRRKKEK
jgi:hypothetical protein